ncbi:MAG: class I SAM-dependent methyltransferase family protein [Euryarchaeota archaeon]|nr:class I SAM-dependent methyltransferase family protein [Euryarchaeota archaeon]
MPSFDIVGDVAIIKYREEIDVEEFAEYILKKHKNVKNVAVDYGVVGETRVRNVKLIRGDRTETIHREFGIRLKVDIAKVYFSPRLATERWRVVEEVQDGEVIYDMFAGCGPFSVLIAKHRDVKIYAGDINPYAIEYLKENIRLNKLENIVPLLGDAREVYKLIPEKVDRVIMNLPHSAYEFLPFARQVLKKGGKVNYYEILPRGEENSKVFEDFKVLNIRRVHEYSPAKTLYSFLLTI